MKRTINKLLWIIIIAAILVGIAAPIIFWFTYLNVQNVSGDAAYSLLSGPDSRLIPQATFSLVEQTASAIAEYGFATVYKLAALVLIILLWRSRASDLAALRRGLIAALLAESIKLAGAVKFLGNAQDVIIGYVYSMGEAICFGLITYALTVAFDERVIRFSGKEGKCAMLNLCRHCHKYAEVSCNLRLLFLFTTALAGIASFMPLTAGFIHFYYKGSVFGETEVFGMPLAQQIMALRVLPGISLLFFVISWVVLFWKKEEGITAAKILFAVGAGPLGYSLLSFLIYWGFQSDPLWGEFWEDCTEFLFIMAVGATLLIFRKSLFDHGQDNTIAH